MDTYGPPYGVHLVVRLPPTLWPHTSRQIDWSYPQGYLGEKVWVYIQGGTTCPRNSQKGRYRRSVHEMSTKICAGQEGFSASRSVKEYR